MIHRIPIFFLLVLCGLRGPACPGQTLIEDLQARALRYFIDNANPTTGLVRDRARNFDDTPPTGEYSVASIAATGFGLAVLTNSCLHQRYSCSDAQSRILTTLEFAKKMPNFHGWYYHFVDWASGQRHANSEISTVDTAWFLAGALYAGQAFRGTRIERLANELYERVDFETMRTDGGRWPKKLTLAMGWLPESGYLPFEWDSYAEHMLLVLLGLGHPTHPLPEGAWLAWERPKLQMATGLFLIGPKLPLFAHQYSQIFVDMRHFFDHEGNYFINSRVATLRDRSFCLTSNDSQTYQAGFWGLSASDSPGGYLAFSLELRNGTVCLGCAGASIIFEPSLVLSDLKKWATGPYAKRLLGKYGFVDGVNLDKGWFDQDVIGITIGALSVALADLDGKDSPWELLSRYVPLQRGLKRAHEAHP